MRLLVRFSGKGASGPAPKRPPWGGAGAGATYALEGNILVTGGAVQWLGEFLGLEDPARDAAALACEAPDTAGLYLVPAFVGLGAPYWNAQARGLITGLTRGTTAAQVARATLDSIACQVRDVFDAMRADVAVELPELLADGGASQNDSLVQFQADILGRPVIRDLSTDLSAIGAAWLEENDLQATALQCWSSLQESYGINCCTIMSMMSEKLMPSACEVDVAGVVAMYALQLASGRPSALVDWNNNYGKDPNKCVFFHCGNWAKSYLPGIQIGTAPILGTTLGEENTYGALAGRTPSGPVTFARVSTDDLNGRLRAYAGEGRFTDDPLATFGSRAVVEVPELQKLMRYICRNGFEHHAAMNASRCGSVLAEAMETYLGWPVYSHELQQD